MTGAARLAVALATAQLFTAGGHMNLGSPPTVFAQTSSATTSSATETTEPSAQPARSTVRCQQRSNPGGNIKRCSIHRQRT